MILFAIPVVFATAVALLYGLLRRQAVRGNLWRTAIRLGVGVGIARAGLASLGWYVVERTGGPLQVPAYSLAMMAWPEAVVLPQTRGTMVPFQFYVLLSLVLVAGTMLFVSVVALLVEVSRMRTGQDHRT